MEQSSSSSSSGTQAMLRRNLRASAPLAGLSDKEFMAVMGLLRSLNVPAGGILLERGGRDVNLYIVRKGSACLRSNGGLYGTPNETVIGAGSVFNEASYQTGAANEITVEAISDLQVWYIPREAGSRYQPTGQKQVPPVLRPPRPVPLEGGSIAPSAETEEKTLIYRRGHWWIIGGQFLPFLFLLAILIVLRLPPIYIFTRDLFTYLVAAFLTLFVSFAVLKLIRWWQDTYTVTTKRISHRRHLPLIRDEREEIPVERVQDVTVMRVTLTSFVLNFGDVIVESQGQGSKVLFHSIRNPDGVSQLISELAGLSSGAQDTAVREKQGRRSGGLLQVFLPSKRLVQGDNVLYHKHWLQLVRDIVRPSLGIVGFLLILLFLYLNPDLGWIFFETPLLLLVVVTGSALLGWLGWRYEDWRNDVYILTPMRVIDVDRSPFGLLREKRHIAGLGVIQNVSATKKGLLDNLLNIGDVTVRTAGAEGNLTFTRVWDPLEIQREIEEMRTLFESKMLDKRSRQMAILSARETVRLLKTPPEPGVVAGDGLERP
jgi:membrane protein YdbS with pleckstrin-like domain